MPLTQTVRRLFRVRRKSAMRVTERAVWHKYENEMKRSRRVDFLARACLVLAVLSIGAIPIRAVLPDYAAALIALPKTDIGTLQAVWLLSHESILPVILFLVLAVLFSQRIETRD